MIRVEVSECTVEDILCHIGHTSPVLRYYTKILRILTLWQKKINDNIVVNTYWLTHFLPITVEHQSYLTQVSEIWILEYPVQAISDLLLNNT